MMMPKRKRRMLSAADLARVAAVRLRHLKKLAAMRHRGVLPDDRRGRDHLTALLACGLTGPEARRLAPWLAARELDDMIAQMDRPELWTAQRLGALVELTDEERERGQLWSLHPVDVSWSDVKERAKGRHRTRSRDYQRNRRARLRAVQAMARDLDLREESLLTAMGPAWMPASRLLAQVKGGRAWKKLSASSLRVVAHRTLDALAARGLIESKIEGADGTVSSRFVRVSATWAKRDSVTVTAVTVTDRPQVPAVSAGEASVFGAATPVASKSAGKVSPQSYNARNTCGPAPPRPHGNTAARGEAKGASRWQWPFPAWTPPLDQWELPRRDISVLLSFAREQRHLARWSDRGDP
jgi:hypothetical protein